MDETLALVDALSNKGLDYLHVSLFDFFSTPRRGVEDLTKLESLIFRKQLMIVYH